MARRPRVIDRDRGLKKFLQRFKEARGARVKVGVTESVGREPKKTREGSAGEDLTVLLIAWWNEYGTHRTLADGRRVQHVPPRSFIRTTTDEQRVKIFALKKRLIAQIIDGKLTVRQALGVLGEFLQKKIQSKIVRLRDPPNAPSTITRKGSSNPLIDIGQLLQSIRYEVMMGAERVIA